uniref:Uncharacterized protein n=1 Tax=Rhizophora mucronata TaxID=61149 RepID=A0A2P2Q7N4_RHIMU
MFTCCSVADVGGNKKLVTRSNHYIEMLMFRCLHKHI